MNDPAAALLRERGLPCVALGRPVSPDEDTPYVDLRGGLVAEMLLTHLHAQGATQPALIIGSGERHSSVDLREAYACIAAQYVWAPIVGTRRAKARWPNRFGRRYVRASDGRQGFRAARPAATPAWSTVETAIAVGNHEAVETVRFGEGRFGHRLRSARAQQGGGVDDG
ncbi:hypothetical protein [Streptomyces katrae]|uniref:hypothetical protein n=1 Tax=Streptomyces katrae TaxID=68223 RepID=UPI001F257A17|nr:hypothetical protein [Streptomyces katrae]